MGMNFDDETLGRCVRAAITESTQPIDGRSAGEQWLGVVRAVLREASLTSPATQGAAVGDGWVAARFFSDAPAASPRDGQWVRCTPALLDSGVSCADTPRRDGDGTYSHDHLIAAPSPATEQAGAECEACGDTGKVFNTEGDGPWGCYRCKPAPVGADAVERVTNAMVERAAKAVEKMTTAASYGWTDEQFEVWWNKDPLFVEKVNVWAWFTGTRKEKLFAETRAALAAATQEGAHHEKGVIRMIVDELSGPAIPSTETHPAFKGGVE